MSDFCSDTNVDFFNQLFNKIHFMKNHFSDCFFIKNNSPDFIDLTKLALLKKDTYFGDDSQGEVS